MLIAPTVNLEKLRLEAYRDSGYSEKVVIDGKDRFEVMINPETITRKIGIEYSEVKENGNRNNGTYFKNKPEDFKLDVLLDSTGIIPSTNEFKFTTDLTIKDISAEIELLRKFCVDTNGETHRPHFLKLFWGAGDSFFKGALTNLDIDYKLFTPDARPIRAVAHISLISAISASDAVLLESAQSPDITHERQIESSDTLHLLCHKFYKDNTYYTDVAKANKMNSFRKIKTGSKILFPPVK